MGNFWPTRIHVWRELADPVNLCNGTDDRSDGLCNDPDVAEGYSKILSLHCQYRYPSPRRFGSFRSGPTPLLLTMCGQFRRPGDHTEKCLEKRPQTADSAAHKTKQNKGSTLCNLSVFFSPSSLLRRFRRVSTTILSVAWPAQQLALLSQKPQALTRLPVPSQAALRVRCATKSSLPAVKAAGGHSARMIKNLQTSEPMDGSGVSFSHSRKGQRPWQNSSNSPQPSRPLPLWRLVTTTLNVLWVALQQALSSAKPQAMMWAPLRPQARLLVSSATTQASVTNTTRFGATDTYLNRRAGDIQRGGFAF